jgi:hypothetical protein
MNMEEWPMEDMPKVDVLMAVVWVDSTSRVADGVISHLDLGSFHHDCCYRNAMATATTWVVVVRAAGAHVRSSGSDMIIVFLISNESRVIGHMLCAFIQSYLF